MSTFLVLHRLAVPLQIRGLLLKGASENERFLPPQGKKVRVAEY